MAGNEFKIKIGADNSELKSVMADTAETTKKTGDVLKKFGTDIAKGADQSARSVADLNKALSAVSFDEVAAGNAAMVRISKSIDEAAASAVAAGKDFQSFGSRVPLQGINSLRAAVKSLKNEINIGIGSSARFAVIPPSTPKIIDDTAKAAAKLKTSSSSAALALNDVGRIAQDLPFGFIGIQNNLNPMLESFRRLKAESGSTGGAFKALAGSIGGVGGLGLALSVASSAFLIIQNGIAGFNHKTKEAKEKTDDLADSLKSVKQIQNEAIGSAQAEVAEVRTLAEAILDVNKSNTERKRALEALKQVNEAYFGDLKFEATALGTLTTKVNEYTQALIVQAAQKGFSNEIGQANAQLVKQNILLSDARDKLNASIDAQKTLNSHLPRNKAGFLVIPSNIKEIRELADAYDVNKEALAKIKTEAFATEDSLVLLKKGLEESVNASLKFQALGPDTGKREKEVDALKDRIGVLQHLRTQVGLLKNEERELGDLEIELFQRDGAKNGLDSGQLERGFQALVDQQAASQKIKINLPIAVLPKVGLSVKDALGGLLPEGFDAEMIKRFQDAGLEAGKAFRAYIEKGYKGFETDLQENVSKALQFQKQFEQLGVSFSDSLKGALINALSDVGEIIGQTIGAAISGEKFEPLKALTAALGDSLAQLGRITIQYGLEIALLKKTLALGITQPGALIAIGIGMVAAGQLMKASFKGPRLADGGITTGPQIAMIGEAGREAIIPLNKLSSLMNSGAQRIEVAESYIRGQDIVQIWRQITALNNRIH